MRVTLVSRLDDAEALRYTASLGRELKDLGHDVVLEEGTARHLRRNGGTPFEEIDADLVVVVGGDGSVLLTVQRMRKQVPILGINWGRWGSSLTWSLERRLISLPAWTRLRSSSGCGSASPPAGGCSAMP